MNTVAQIILSAVGDGALDVPFCKAPAFFQESRLNIIISPIFFLSEQIKRVGGRNSVVQGFFRLNGARHTEISERVGEMVFLRGIEVLGVYLAILQEGEGTYSIFTGIEEIDHRLTLVIEGKAIMHLHPTGDTAVVGFLEIDLMSVSGGNNRLTAVLAPYRRVGDTDNALIFKPTVLCFDAVNFGKDFFRVPLNPLVRNAV